MRNTLLKPIFCLVVVLSLASAEHAYAQAEQKTLDSLLAINNAYTKRDSLKITHLRKISRQYLRLKDLANGESYGLQSLNLAISLGMTEEIAFSYYLLGISFHGTTDYVKALQYYQKALDIYRKTKNQDWVGGIYLNIGALYMKIPDYTNALDYNQKAVEIHNLIGNKANLASSYMNISEIYSQLKEYSQSIQYIKKALTIFESLGGKQARGVAVAHSGMANIYLQASAADLSELNISEQDRYDKAFDHLNTAFSIGRYRNDYSIMGPAQRNLGLIYEKKGDYALAQDNYLQSYVHNSKENDKVELGLSLLSLGNFYLRQEQYDKARAYFDQVLETASASGILNAERDALESLSLLYQAKGQYNESLEYYKRHVGVKEKIFSQDAAKEILRRQLKLDYTIKEKDYQVQQQLISSELRQREQQLILNKQQLQLSDKEKTLQRLAFLKKQADLENEKRMQAAILDQEKQQANYKQAVNERQMGLQKAEIAYNKRKSQFLILLATILSAAGISMFYSWHKSKELNKLVLAQKLELENLVTVKDTLLNVVSHDMRTPINSLIAFMQLLELGNIEPRKLEIYTSTLKESLGYTSGMMENLLNWAASQMQGFKPENDPFDIQLAASDVVHSFSEQARKKKINILNNIPSGTLVMADVNMTSLVLRNLISNAIKFTPENGSVTLSAYVKDQAICTAIEDTGIGIPDEFLTEFNSTSRSGVLQSRLGTNHEKGTGLGLLLCKTFTNVMSGNLRVNRNEPNGSTFRLLLPAA